MVCRSFCRSLRGSRSYDDWRAVEKKREISAVRAGCGAVGEARRDGRACSAASSASRASATSCMASAWCSRWGTNASTAASARAASSAWETRGTCAGRGARADSDASAVASTRREEQSRLAARERLAEAGGVNGEDIRYAPMHAPQAGSRARWRRVLVVPPVSAYEIQRARERMTLLRFQIVSPARRRRECALRSARRPAEVASTPQTSNASSARSMARPSAAALLTVSWYSLSGFESATMPAPA